MIKNKITNKWVRRPVLVLIYAPIMVLWYLGKALYDNLDNLYKDIRSQW